MKYFTLKELTRTSTGLPNVPGSAEVANLTNLVDKVLDPLRAAYGRPIRVNSGYRCMTVNIAVNGKSTSQHPKGEAADITAGSPAENRRLFEMLRGGGYPFDQLIDEYNYTWIHVSLKRNGINRKQILHES
ncbi:MAG: peptidase M15 [Prevotellaceae bacterium]|jgi:uncharacterized protein YcbK (DUF882 family)|nr:peptidase M15 [Prevotellaceae bacterium]